MDGRTSAGPPPARAPSPVLEAALVVAVASAAAVVASWPLALHLGDRAQNAVDAPFQAWTIDHVQWAISEGRSLWDANIFQPGRHTLAYSDNLVGVAVPLLPLRWLGVGPLPQLNVALLVGVATSAAAGYAFGRLVTGARAAAAVTGAAFALGPFAVPMSDHLHATFHPGVALAATGAWSLADRLRDGRGVGPPVALLAGSVLWQALVSFYPGAYAGVAVVVVVVVRWRDLGRRGVLLVVGALLVAVAATALFARPYFVVLDELPFVRSATEVADLGIDPTTVDRRLWLWGTALGADGLPFPAFPGAALLTLSAVGLASGLWARGRTRRAAIAGVAFLLVGAFLAFGTADDGWRGLSPYRLLFDHVPGFKLLRAAGRAWILGLLGLGLLAGLGCTVVGRRLGRWGGAVVAALVVAAVVAEGLAPWRDRPRIEVSAADRALADDPRPGGVLYLPALASERGLAVVTNFGQVENVFGTTAHRRPTPNGYSGLVPDRFRALSARMRALPSPVAVRELQTIGVRFVVVRSWAAGTPWAHLADPWRAAPLELVGTFDGDRLYEVPSVPVPG
jgi:MFS family permease